MHAGLELVLAEDGVLDRRKRTWRLRRRTLVRLEQPHVEDVVEACAGRKLQVVGDSLMTALTRYGP